MIGKPIDLDNVTYYPLPTIKIDCASPGPPAIGTDILMVLPSTTVGI